MFKLSDFWDEIEFFHHIAQRDLLNEKYELVSYSLEKTIQSFYGARMDIDKYAVKKSTFLLDNLESLIYGHSMASAIKEFMDNLENKIK